jgi:60 kDa SS-A/Ro ribonucleoprotein
MANKNLFKTIAGKLVPKTNASNDEGAVAYAMSAKHALAQYAVTGCLNGTFYATEHDQLAAILELCAKVDSEFIARVAIYCREEGYMKDMPALLCAVLTTRNPALLESIFPRVIDNGKMLRNFVQILRSGVVGRKSLGTAPKRLILRWLEARTDEQLFRDSVGQSPSLADIVRMVHPKPAAKSREALYGYLIGRPYDVEKLPSIVREFEAFKAKATTTVPDVPFQMLTALELDSAAWMAIARKAPWHMTRMNLNTFARHGVFTNEEVTTMIAARLADPDEIKRARVFPYQLMTAFLSLAAGVPEIVRNGMQEAMEAATANVPAIEGKVYVCPDVSGSMSSPVTGFRKGATSVTRCIDVAALVAASIIRKNPTAEVLPFSTVVVDVRLNTRDSVMTNAARLAAIGGGGTTCSAPLAALNRRKATGDLVIFISDYESWADPKQNRGTAMMAEWNTFKHRNPEARLICIDIAPNGTTQASEQTDVTNIGGFSDSVFRLLATLSESGNGSSRWADMLESIILSRSAVA